MQIPTDGPQTKDIPLPWENSQIDAARRTFLDRHPLAKNKEQVALAKGEGLLLSVAIQVYAALFYVSFLQFSQYHRSRLLMRGSSIILILGVHSCIEVALLDVGEDLSASATFTVEKNSSRIEVCDSLTLHRNILPKADATAVFAAASQAAASDPSPSKSSKSPRQSAEQTAGSARSSGPSDGAPPNTLRVTLHPAGAGTYPSKIVLASGDDIRVLDLEFVALRSGQQVTLEFSGPARDKLVQEVSQPSYSQPSCMPQQAEQMVN